MTSEEIKHLLDLAVINLFKHQPDLFDFTDDSSQTEWDINHHYANEVQSLLPDYVCDVDLKKPGFQNKRPDIVFHKRKTHKCNFLVIEMKRKEKDIIGEIERIKTLWFEKPLKYKFGAVVMISGLGSYKIVFLENKDE